VSIQVEGRLKCIGKITHVKKKYSNGYEVEVKVEPITKETMSELIAND